MLTYKVTKKVLGKPVEIEYGISNEGRCLFEFFSLYRILEVLQAEPYDQTIIEIGSLAQDIVVEHKIDHRKETKL